MLIQTFTRSVPLDDCFVTQMTWRQRCHNKKPISIQMELFKQGRFLSMLQHLYWLVSHHTFHGR